MPLYRGGPVTLDQYTPAELEFIQGVVAANAAMDIRTTHKHLVDPVWQAAVFALSDRERETVDGARKLVLERVIGAIQILLGVRAAHRVTLGIPTGEELP